MLDNLVVSLRTEALAANLDKLNRRLTSNSRRRQSLEKVVKTLQAVRVQLDDLTKTLKTTSDTLGDVLTDNPSLDRKIQKDLTALTEAIRELDEKRRRAAERDRESPEGKDPRTNMQGAIAMVNYLSSRCFRLDEGMVGQELTQALKDQTLPLLATVSGLRAKVQGLGESAPEGQAVWNALRRAIHDQNEKLFSEYIEVLGGVALRDSEFDENISELADELLPSYAGNSQQQSAFAIPVRQQACFLETFKRIIRVSFPDWTIWALPATAREFWQVIEKDKWTATLKANIEALPKGEQDQIRDDHWEYLGDAFATYTMGPAYAMMAITLMLDPLKASDNHRVRAIFAMLDRMDVRLVGYNPYLSVRKQLLHAWNTAVVQNERTPLSLNPDAPEHDDASDPDGQGIRTLIRVFEQVLDKGTSAGFTAQIWSGAEKWSEPLRKGETDTIVDTGGAEIRHVLNAAWLARVHRLRPLEIPPHEPEQSLTAAVERLRDKVRNKK